MLEAIDESLGTLVNVIDMTVREVGFEHGDNLVVGLLAIDHSEAANWFCLQKKIALGKRFFGEHADVHRIAITLDVTGSGAFGAEFRHLFTTKSLRNEPVERRAHR